MDATSLVLIVTILGFVVVTAMSQLLNKIPLE